MSLFRNMDLYKGIVLLSILLLPAGGFWVKNLKGQIEECEGAIQEATRRGGLLEQIGSLQKKVEIVAQNKRTTSDAINAPGTYFEGQIMAASPSLSTNDFSPKSASEEKVTLRGSRQRASDFVVDVEWRKDLKVKMDFVYAVLFNCESGARGGGNDGRDAGQPSVWRLRNLTLVNATDERLTTSRKVPPPELQDEWLIKEMKFARREPTKADR